MAADLFDVGEQETQSMVAVMDGWWDPFFVRWFKEVTRRWQDHLALMKRVTTRVISEEEVRMSRQWWWSGPWHRVEIYRGDTSCCVVLYWAVWYCILLPGITWYCIVLYYPAWYCTARIIIWYCLVLRCIAWYRTSKAIERGVLSRL